MNTLQQHPRVRHDLAKAFRWYEGQWSGLGQDFLAEVRALLLRLPLTARHHSVRFADYRRVNLKRFPYAFFYFIEGQRVRVLAVRHTRSRYQRILIGRRGTFPDE